MIYLIGILMIVLSAFLTRRHFKFLKTSANDEKRLKLAVVLEEFFFGPSLFYLLIGLVGIVFLVRGKFG